MKEFKWQFKIDAIYDPNNMKIKFIRKYNEERIKQRVEIWHLIIKPKPKWMPFVIWQRLLNRIFYIQVSIDKGGEK